ncbi:TIGR02281 family clan AA aspartic protease [Aminobacter sp. HY435]|uniref:TIGR02281 family clan AA aspartic protease n=1 Tax=Aminobacter sp. HY435 TaxID=2970917 RepID=UPI0022B9B2C6|nr:TIGR02281 family clan AA aspartic protease [Aminobacter sp. HY435]
MLRKVIIFSLCAGAAASLPSLYEKHGDTFRTFVAGDAETGASTPSTVEVSTATATTSGRRVVIDQDMRGHFTASFKINGRSVDALVDTGATLVAINLSTARRAGVKVTASDFTREVNTANGTAKAAVALIDRVQIGKITVEDVDAVVLEDKALQGTLVGMSFLSRLKKYQVENGALLLVQ